MGRKYCGVKNYTKNIRVNTSGINRRTSIDWRMEGFKIGLMCGMVFLNDKWDLTDEEIRDYYEGSIKVVRAFGKELEDPAKVFKALREMLGDHYLDI